MREAQRAAYREANPDAKQIKLSKEERAASDWSQEGMRFRLRLESADVACDLDEALGLSTLKSGEWLVISPRWTVDSRLPVAEQVPFTPTAKQMLYGVRAELDRITVRAGGRPRGARPGPRSMMKGPRAGGGPPDFVFGTFADRPFEPGKTYTLDPDPNDFNGSHDAQVWPRV